MPVINVNDLMVLYLPNVKLSIVSLEPPKFIVLPSWFNVTDLTLVARPGFCLSLHFTDDLGTCIGHPMHSEKIMKALHKCWIMGVRITD